MSVSEIAITFQADVTCALHVSVNGNGKLYLDYCVANKVPKVPFILVDDNRVHLLSTLLLLCTKMYVVMKRTTFCHF